MDVLWEGRVVQMFAVDVEETRNRSRGYGTNSLRRTTWLAPNKVLDASPGKCARTTGSSRRPCLFGPGRLSGW